MMHKNDPLIYSDFPDPDVIRVDDTYYMISTTMHMFPGGVILRSYDLLNWEILTYVFDELDRNSASKLEAGQNIYGQGMWAPSMRHHNGRFYICFAANDTRKTYLYQSEQITGPWEKSEIEGFYHDSSLLFDEVRVFLVYGNTQIYLTELLPDLSGPKPDCLDRIIITDQDHVSLGYEGSHIQKINGKYYVFLVHWLADGTKRRTQACFVSDSLEGIFTGKDVLDDDHGFQNAGIAQGGLVDTPEGDWYAMLFQDHGAIGRCPVLVPVEWENDFPVFGYEGKVPLELEIRSTKQNHSYAPLTDSDSFSYEPNPDGSVSLKNVWQWNHIPDNSLWSVTDKPGALRVTTKETCTNVVMAKNMLTQRMMGPVSDITVQIDASKINEGDFAGICALQGCYGWIAVTKRDGQYSIVMTEKELDPDEGIWGPEGGDKSPGTEQASASVTDTSVELRIVADFTDGIDEVRFFYKNENDWKQLGPVHKLYFRLDHFMGCRVGLFLYSTQKPGGSADFMNYCIIR